MSLIVVWYAKASQTALCTHKPPKLSFGGFALGRSAPARPAVERHDSQSQPCRKTGKI